MLDATDLAGMRTDATAALPDACTVRRRTRTSDGQGGYTVGTTTLTSYACRLGSMGPGQAEQLLGDKPTTPTPYLLTLPYSADVKNGDLVAIGSRSFEVVGVYRPSWATATRLACTEVL